MSRYELSKYKIYCRSHGIVLGKNLSGIPFLRPLESLQRGKWMWRKDSYDWEFAELYYKIDKDNLIEDAFK
jgi:hypothetical protein